MNMDIKTKKNSFKEIILKDKVNLLDFLQTGISRLLQLAKETEIKKSKTDKIASFDLNSIFTESNQEEVNPILSFSYSGLITYKHPSGNTYRARLRKGNEYDLMLFLAQNPYRYFTTEELSNLLKKQRRGANATSERRVRDTIQGIKKSLGLDKDHPHDFFTTNVDNFGISCDSAITQ